MTPPGGETSTPAYPPIQPCPVCGARGRLRAKAVGLALDATCTDCGQHYTTTARQCILRALTGRPDWRRNRKPR
jgi:hypothetical protein